MDKSCVTNVFTCGWRSSSLAPHAISVLHVTKSANPSFGNSDLTNTKPDPKLQLMTSKEVLTVFSLAPRSSSLTAALQFLYLLSLAPHSLALSRPPFVIYQHYTLVHVISYPMHFFVIFSNRCSMSSRLHPAVIPPGPGSRVTHVNKFSTSSPTI